MTPEVSVLMAVRDAERWVGDAVRSVLAQSMGDLELIVIDDGSEDRTADVLAGLTDPRMIVERGPGRGLSAALCRAFARSRAPLIARLDADDVAVTERFEWQRAFLAAAGDVGMVGGAAREVDVAGRTVRTVIPPSTDAEIRRRLIRDNPFVHSTITMRRAAYDRAGGYDPSVPVAQDYDLWMRMSRVTRLANLSDVLVIRRLVPGRIGVTRDSARLRTEMRTRWRAVRAGAYPWWALAFVARPALALALPPPLRRLVRRARDRAWG